MMKKNRMAVCSFVRTKAAEPRLVALLPQQEELEDGIQVQSSLESEYSMSGYRHVQDKMIHPEWSPCCHLKKSLQMAFRYIHLLK